VNYTTESEETLANQRLK